MGSVGSVCWRFLLYVYTCTPYNNRQVLGGVHPSPASQAPQGFSAITIRAAEVQHQRHPVPSKSESWSL